MNQYERAGIVPLQALDLIARIENPTKKDFVNFCGKEVHADSVRYQVFLQKGTRCVKCGIEGHYFAVEKVKWEGNPSGRYHLNLYHRRKDNTEVMITADHRLPKSRGGKRIVPNLDPMCSLCNKAKGNRDERGRENPRKSKVDTIRMLSKIVEGYDAELKSGKRAAEAAYFAGGVIRQIDEVLKDATIGGMMGLFNISMGEVHGYRATDEEKEELRKLREAFETLRERAEQVNTCEHFFIPLSYFGGGFAPPSMDARCSRCESVLVVRHPATIARMLDANVADLVKEDSGGGMYVSHFSKELVDRCKELGIPRDSGATPSLGGSIIDGLKLAGYADVDEED